MSPVAAKKKQFSFESPLLVVLHLKLLSRKVLRSRVRKEVAIVAMSRFSQRDVNSALALYMYRLIAFEF